MSIPDREAQLKAQTKVTGIDFISVEKTLQKTLDVHFYVPPSKLTPDRLSIALPDGDNADILKKIRMLVFLLFCCFHAIFYIFGFLSLSYYLQKICFFFFFFTHQQFL